MTKRELASTEVSISVLVIAIFAGLFTGCGLWGLYLAARYLLMLLGVQFDSM